MAKKEQGTCQLERGIDAYRLFYVTGERKVEIAAGILKYYHQGSYLFIERFWDKFYGWSCVEDGDSVVRYLGRLFDDYYLADEGDRLRISFFDKKQRIHSKFCKKVYAETVLSERSDCNAALILEKESGKCTAYLRTVKAPADGCREMEPYLLEKGQLLTVSDEDGKKWTFMAPFANNFGRVIKLGPAKRRWQVLEQEGIAFYRSVWDILLGRYKF